MAIYVRRLWDSVKEDIETDITWNRAKRLTVRRTRALPRASRQYIFDKFPVLEWLPHYQPRWFINDAVAGITVGLMLVPQSLSYAKIAAIPVQYGLTSSWLPAAVYALMGTSKDVSIGPTSLVGLLTYEVVLAMPEYPPDQVASAIAMLMGIYGMVIGFLKLGFVLDFISTPVLTGFISGVVITIILNQIPSLLGETKVGNGTADQINDIFARLPHASGYDCLLGFACILFLTILDHAGHRWGRSNKVTWLLSITRAFLALALFTGISYAVNHKRGDPSNYLFAVTLAEGKGIEHPNVPDTSLIGQVAGHSISLFVGAAVEHMAVARRFGAEGDYAIDQSQELSSLGIANFFNSFFHSMGVGGALSRSAVNKACNVKSPLSGLITAAVVVVSIYKLVGTLYWTPKSVLAAIIICAVIPLISSPKTFYRYWKTSLADWTSCMLAFWVTLFVSTQVGLAVSVGFNIIYFMLRQVCTSVHTINNSDCLGGPKIPRDVGNGLAGLRFPQDVHVFQFGGPIFFPNAYRLKTKIMDAIQTSHMPAHIHSLGSNVERNWSVAREERVERLRKRARIIDEGGLPPLKLTILEFSKVNYIDTTAISHLESLLSEIKKYAGDEVGICFVGVPSHVKERLKRARWKLVNADGVDNTGDESATRLFDTMGQAILRSKRRDTSCSDVENGILKGEGGLRDIEKALVVHRESPEVSRSVASTLCE